MEKNDDFDLQDFMPFLLNRAAEESSLSFQTYYKNRYGMLRNEWRVLFHLGTYGQMTAKEIGLKAKIHKTKISRAVAKLSERRFVLRTRDESDRRSEHLVLTSVGETVYHDLKAQAQAYDVQLLAQFTQDEIAALRNMLRRLAGMNI